MADRRVRIGAGIAVLLALVMTIGLAVFPWHTLKGRIESRLSHRFGRPVTIASIDRLDRIGFTPTIAITGVRIPQTAWAGTGDMATIDHVTARFSVWPLLVGHFRPRDIVVTGMRLNLVRAGDGRENWREGGDRKHGGRANPLRHLTVRDSIVSYRDAKQNRAFVVTLGADATGVRVRGRGAVRGAPVTLAASGPSIAAVGPWPFEARIAGDRLSMTAKGMMDRPLDTGGMTLDLTARADDLKLIDAVIEAGLFSTQPLSLTAHVRHDGQRWTVTGLRGTIGRSDLSGRLTVDKQDGRTKLDGAITSRQLDFDDLASDRGIAEAEALKREIGPRIVPNTRIDIGKIDRTDGVIRFDVGRIVSRSGPSSVLALSGALTLDHQLLILSPMRLRLRQGDVTGRVIVDQRGGRPAPVMTADIWLRNATVRGLAGGDGDFTGSVEARARLRGIGETVRAAVGTSDGTIGFVAHDGQMPKKIAAALGFDAGRALTAGKDSAGLRCVVLRLAMKNGRGVADPLIVDTTESQLRGTGTITFPGETLALTLTGAPKHGAALRLPGSATLGGTISRPDLVIPKEVKSVGNIFRAIGRAITGKQGPVATDADCAALAAKALE